MSDYPWTTPRHTQAGEIVKLLDLAVADAVAAAERAAAARGIEEARATIALASRSLRRNRKILEAASVDGHHRKILEAAPAVRPNPRTNGAAHLAAE